MDLHIIDRIHIPTILPSENTFLDFNIKRDIIKKVALTTDDVVKYSIKEDSDSKRTTWDAKADREHPLAVDFTPQELNYLKTACEKLSDHPAPDHLWNTIEKIYTAVSEQ